MEVPLGDFFAIGNGRFAPINSAVVVDIPLAALNCYWPMPFAKHARMTFTNDSDHELSLLTYQVDYETGAIPADSGYFHAQWRRARVQRNSPSYTILDGMKGEGRYVGTFLSWNQLSSGWSGEGEVKFYIDGDSELPTIVGTGTEDYFGADWGFPQNYSTQYVGAIWTNRSAGQGDHPMPQIPSNDYPAGSEWNLYRWHILDPITFHHDLKVTIQDLGWWPRAAISRSMMTSLPRRSGTKRSRTGRSRSCHRSVIDGYGKI